MKKQEKTAREKLLSVPCHQCSSKIGEICTDSLDGEGPPWGHPVRYVEARPTLQDLGRSNLAELDENDLDKILHTKFKAWEHEAEYRAFCDLEHRDPVSDLYFLPFSEHVRLAQVIIGERSKVTRDTLARVLGERAGAVSSFKARAGFTKFEVVKNKRQSAWQ